MATSDWVGISIVAREEWMDERNGSLGCFNLLAFFQRRKKGNERAVCCLLPCFCGKESSGRKGREVWGALCTDSSSQSIYCLVIEVPPVDFFLSSFIFFLFFFPPAELTERTVESTVDLRCNASNVFFLKILTHPMVLASAQTYP